MPIENDSHMGKKRARCTVLFCSVLCCADGCCYKNTHDRLLMMMMMMMIILFITSRIKKTIDDYGLKSIFHFPRITLPLHLDGML
jgi:hypothetical protein